jgi:transforming growth factor-beta-induced protein
MKFIEQTYLRRLLSLLVVLTAAVVLVSCEDDDDVVDDDPVGTIYQEISGANNYTILEAAINKAGLQSTLEGSGSFTLFAPNDNAFVSAGITDLDDYSADELAAILQYHMVDSEIDFAALSGQEEVETLNGIVYVTPFNDNNFLNARAGFLQADAEATNGVIHVIDRVLFPPENEISAIITESEGLSILEEALLQVGVENVLTGSGPYTIFAPSDDAFTALFDELDVTTINELSDEQLMDILQYHIVSDRVFSTELVAGDQGTLLGQNFAIDFEGNSIVIIDDNETSEDAVVVAGDFLGTNGIVHIVDEVLLPE